MEDLSISDTTDSSDSDSSTSSSSSGSSRTTAESTSAMEVDEDVNVIGPYIVDKFLNGGGM